MLHLGILILKRLSVETKESKLLLVFNKIHHKLNYNLNPVEVVQSESTTNILRNSVVLAGFFCYSLLGAHYRAQLSDDTSLYN